MAFTTIDDPSGTSFDTALYTGNQTARTITIGFQPDWVWTKARNSAHHHITTDAVTGAGKRLRPSATNNQGTNTASVASFVSTGYTLTDDVTINGNSENNVSFSWKEGATQGFDILTYTGNGGTQNISHNLSAVPEFIIGKQTSGSSNGWGIYHVATGNTKCFEFDNNAPSTATAFWNDTTPTSSVFSLGDSGRLNQSSESYVAYVFAPIKGFSSFGTYKGNNDNNGIYVHCGFTPAFVWIRRFDSGDDWKMVTRKIDGFNPMNKSVKSNSSVTEATESDHAIDFTAMGFKLRENNSAFNGSGDYLYCAWAESPMVNSNGNPNTAK